MSWLREIRSLKEITQADVSQKAHIAQPTYCNIENGKRKPSPKVAKRIATILGFDWTLFFENEGEGPKGVTHD